MLGIVRRDEILPEQHDECTLQRGDCMALETIAPLSIALLGGLPDMAN